MGKNRFYIFLLFFQTDFGEIIVSPVFHKDLLQSFCASRFNRWSVLSENVKISKFTLPWIKSNICKFLILLSLDH